MTVYILPLKTPPTKPSYVCHLNAQSLMNKMDELHSVLTGANRPVVLGVSETWLDHSIPTCEVSVPSYVLHRRDRGRRGGGILVYTPAKLRGQRRGDLEAEDVEAIWLELHLQKKTILFGTIYCPPGADQKVLDSIADMLDRVARKQKEVVLMGDFNCDMLKPQPLVAARELLTSTEELNMRQLISTPTRVPNHSASLIDLLFTTNPDIFSSVGAASVTGSDHQMIYGECRDKLPFIATVSYVRSFKRCDVEALLADLCDAPWQVIDAADDRDEKWSTWKTLFLSVIDRHAPLVKVRIKKNRSDWLTANIHFLMRSRNYYYRQYLKSRSQATWDRYKTLRKEVNRQIRQAKASHFITISEEMRKQPKLAWSKLNAALGRTRASAPLSHYITSERTMPDESTVANSLIDHFSIPPANTTSTTHSISPASCSSIFRLSEVSETEVLKKLFNLDAGKATGPDRISARLLRMVAPSIAQSITSLFNASLTTGQFPSEWKEANITPVPKPGGKRDFNSLRPISVQPVLAKVLETVVAAQLTDYLESNKLLSDAQSGFRSKHCTQDVLLKCTDDWKTALDKGKVVGTVMIDLSKAFDSICHSLLLRKLEAIGVCDTALIWFTSYLTGRRQRILTHSAC